MVRRRRGDGGCIWWLRRGWVGICAWWWEGIWARWRGWAGESSRCEDPAPTVGIGGDSVAMHRHRPSFAPTWASTGTANGRITTRRAASLRPPRNGRIGFKPPYSKKRPRRKTRRGSIVYRGHFLTGREVLITQFNLTKTVAMRRAALL